MRLYFYIFKNTVLNNIQFTNMFYELWVTECNVCLTEQDYFLVNFCKCNSYICESCCKNVKDYSSKDIYVCVTCRTPEPSTDKNNKMRSIFIEIGEELASRIDSTPGIVSTLSKQEVKCAKRHWHYWFDKLRGHDIVTQYIKSPYTFQEIHTLLYTGRFRWRDEAGICVNKENAKDYVLAQLIRFQQRIS